MNGLGHIFLEKNMNILIDQNFKNFEVVVSDNSDNDEIKNLCLKYTKKLDINYFKNTRKGMAQNTNEAIQNAKGEIIKLLYMDDYLAHKDSIKNIVENFKGNWMVTGYEHDDGIKKYNKRYPYYNKKIIFGKNTIGSPSVLTIKNENIFLFDENMTWLLDCDYYKRLHDKYGEPQILKNINVVIGTGNHQMTHILSFFKKIKEHLYLIKKYKLKLFY